MTAWHREWRDCRGDVWTEDGNGWMQTPEAPPFPREYVEKKWGPLQEVQP